MGLREEGQGIGSAVRRVEDYRLVTGAGAYTDDFSIPGQTYAYVLRSPHAHARILNLRIEDALKTPGVLAVLTGSDLEADGLKPIPHTPFSIHPAEVVLDERAGASPFISQHTILAVDKVRYSGEPVAFIVAESIHAAKDGAERVDVTYETLPAVTSTLAATASDAPIIWEEAGSNLCLDTSVGDCVATERAFAAAHHVVSLKTWVNRVTGVPMEPRAAVAQYDAETQRYHVHAGSGAAHRQKMDLAYVLGAQADHVRVSMKDVGGNYGTKGGFYPEVALAAWSSRRIGRPVKWTSERSESFLSDYQGRDLYIEAELAIDADGNFLAMRGLDRSNVGAFTVSFATLQKSVEVMTGLYRIPAAHFKTEAVVTNTMMTRPYRATGRPEATFVIERLIDMAARQCHFDRLELRRKNLLRADELPFTNPFGMTYDNGDYHAAMNKALSLSDWDGFQSRRAESRVRGRLRGIGLANYVDTGTGVTRERVVLRVCADGYLDVEIGTVSNGQGHETSYAQLCHDWLGFPLDKVRLVQGDTDRIAFGGGSHSGRSMRLASIIIHKASQSIIARAKAVVSMIFDIAPESLTFDGGRLLCSERPVFSMTLAAISELACHSNSLGPGLGGPLEAVCDEDIKEAAFPYGAHACEVDIDPDTGEVLLARYVAVDDVGKAVNPLIVHGQTHGGIAQGVGQALGEDIVYSETGQLLSGSFMDYCMPRAGTLPSFVTEISEVPASTHPLGIRPGGEGGTTAALAVVINAVVDALSVFGVTHVEMPATAQKIFNLIQTHKSQ